MAMTHSLRMPGISELVKVGNLVGKPPWAIVQALCHDLRDTRVNLRVPSGTYMTKE
jgi:hypothetical protein